MAPFKGVDGTINIRTSGGNFTIQITGACKDVEDFDALGPYIGSQAAAALRELTQTPIMQELRSARDELGMVNDKVAAIKQERDLLKQALADAKAAPKKKKPRTKPAPAGDVKADG